MMIAEPGKSDFKVILHSKRANIYYLEKCRVMQKDERVVYLTESKKENLYWNIPVANTTVILLGNGTSITQAAVQMLCSAGVMVGFCGGGATPLYAGTELEWLTPQSEYRPCQYVQAWVSFWFEKQKRLEAAKLFQRARCDFLTKTWNRDRDLAGMGLYSDDSDMEQALEGYQKKISASATVEELLTAEAAFTKTIYRYVATAVGIKTFVRDRESDDKANTFLNHGNYLAYGLAACTLWVLGIPHAFAVMHGKTRRGALVFDVADLIKDAIVLPFSFVCASQGLQDKEFRMVCLQKFTEHKVMDFMFEEVEGICAKFGGDW